MKEKWTESAAQLDSFLAAQAGIWGNLEGLAGRATDEQCDVLLGLLEKLAAASDRKRYADPERTWPP